MAITARAGLGWSQELFLGLTHGGRSPNTWAILCGFSGGLAGSCIENGAVGTQTGTLHGMLASQVGALHSAAQHRSLHGYCSVRSLLTQLQSLRSPRICQLQAGAAGKSVVYMLAHVCRPVTQECCCSGVSVQRQDCCGLWSQSKNHTHIFQL